MANLTNISSVLINDASTGGYKITLGLNPGVTGLLGSDFTISKLSGTKFTGLTHTTHYTVADTSTNSDGTVYDISFTAAGALTENDLILIQITKSGAVSNRISVDFSQTTTAGSAIAKNLFQMPAETGTYELGDFVVGGLAVPSAQVTATAFNLSDIPDITVALEKPEYVKFVNGIYNVTVTVTESNIETGKKLDIVYEAVKS